MPKSERPRLVMQRVDYGFGPMYRIEDLKKPQEEATLALIADPKLANKVFDLVKQDIAEGYSYVGGVR